MSRWSIVETSALCDPATGALVGFLGGDGKEYLIATSAAFAVAQPTLYNPASVAITGGTINAASIGGVTPAVGVFTGLRSTSFFSVLTDGSATPGNVTQNTCRGRAAFAATANSVVVTNSQVAASSSVFVQLGGADATLTSVRVSVAAGSFTVTGNAAATGAVSFDYIVVQN